MFKSAMRKIFVYFICHVLAYAPLVSADQLSFASGDTVAPEITQSEYVDTVVEGASHKITVKVTDNISVKQVVLYYRVIGSDKFQSRLMKNIENTDNYQTKVQAGEIKGLGIEYYVQAEDNSNNTVLHGHSFSPLSVAVVAEKQPVENQSQNEISEADDDGSIFTNKWFWIGIGVLVAGAAAGGGGGGGDTGTSGASITVNTLEPVVN